MEDQKVWPLYLSLGFLPTGLFGCVLASDRHSLPPHKPTPSGSQITPHLTCFAFSGPHFLGFSLLVSPNSAHTFVMIGFFFFFLIKLISNYLTRVCHLLSAKTLSDRVGNHFSISLLTLSITALPLFQNRMITLLLKVNVL